MRYLIKLKMKELDRSDVDAIEFPVYQFYKSHQKLAEWLASHEMYNSQSSRVDRQRSMQLYLSPYETSSYYVCHLAHILSPYQNYREVVIIAQGKNASFKSYY